MLCSTSITMAFCCWMTLAQFLINKWLVFNVLLNNIIDKQKSTALLLVQRLVGVGKKENIVINLRSTLWQSIYISSVSAH